MSRRTRHFDTQTATIASGATTSGVIQIDQYDRGAIIFPAAFTGATVTFLGAQSQSDTFVAVRSASGASSITVVASASITIPDAVFNHHSIKIVSANSEGAARSLVLVLK